MSARIAPPTTKERADAKAAAAALRPRRGEWWETWSKLPGFTRINGQRFTHSPLPGWEYSRGEIKSEMIPDLDALAERGERPTEATR